MTTSLDEFNVHLATAMEEAGASKHFEGRGKWGMALALHGVLISMGLFPQIRYLPGEDQATVWVQAADKAWSSRGILRDLPPIGFELMEEWVPGMAMRFDGVSEEELVLDVDWAEDVLLKAFPDTVEGLEQEAIQPE